MKEVWANIEKHLLEHVPTVVESLNAPASLDDIESLEREMGYTLPEDFKAYLLVHNGQDDPSRLQTFCEEGNILSIHSIIETYRMLNDINESDSSGASDWWARNYLPITDCEGDHLAIDLETGTVVMHGHDCGIEEGIAPSFEAWFKSKLAIFEEGKFSVNDGYLDYWEYNS